MIEAVRDWIGAVAAVTVLLSVAEELMPEGTLRKIAGFAGGLLLLLAVLRPLPGMNADALRREWDAALEDAEHQSRQMAAAGETELAACIEERTAAYISEQAAQQELAVEAAVETKVNGSGLPVPWTAVLLGERSPALAAWIEKELGIPEERQVWNCED